MVCGFFILGTEAWSKAAPRNKRKAYKRSTVGGEGNSGPPGKGPAKLQINTPCSSKSEALLRLDIQETAATGRGTFFGGLVVRKSS